VETRLVWFSRLARPEFDKPPAVTIDQRLIAMVKDSELMSQEKLESDLADTVFRKEVQCLP
jgi:hypothetical protein